jgi:hypothetical protein
MLGVGDAPAKLLLALFNFAGLALAALVSFFRIGHGSS